MVEFKWESYFDDRLFVLYLCPGTVKEIEDGNFATTIYLIPEKAPDSHIWCVVTYRNTNRYPLYRVDSFYKKEDAISYLKEIEPQTPLISLDGKSPVQTPTYEKYLLWKEENRFKDYDFKSLYSTVSSIHGEGNPQESIFQTKEQFKGIK